MPIILTLLSSLLLISCCPKDGIDGSSTINDYLLAVDYFNDSTPVNTLLIPTEDINLQLVDFQGNKEYPSEITRDPKNQARVIFSFDQKWNDRLIHSINLKLSGFLMYDIEFAKLEKSIYQKEPIMLASRASSLGFLCMLNQIGDFLLPSANAMSCKTKSGSKLSYREGTLVNIYLE